MEEHLDRYRMYGLVPYNISPIQQGIQYGHALQEYNNFIEIIRKNKDAYVGSEDEEKVKKLLDDFDTWRLMDKTFIILNGGTSSTMVEHLETLKNSGVDFAFFTEPDLNDMVSGIVFVVPEQVYKRDEWPDFKDWMIKRNPSNHSLKRMSSDDIKTEFDSSYQEWLKMVGGEKVAFLKEFTSQFRLA
jgi:hypothetical protein